MLESLDLIDGCCRSWQATNILLVDVRSKKNVARFTCPLVLKAVT